MGFGAWLFDIYFFHCFYYIDSFKRPTYVGREELRKEEVEVSSLGILKNDKKLQVPIIYVVILCRKLKLLADMTVAVELCVT